MKYKTNFQLTRPVNDFRAAQNFLVEEDMTDYLMEYLLYDEKHHIKGIKHIEWNLLTPDSGEIILETTRELTENELEKISEWVNNQNSDGLGGEFEQQDFAEVYSFNDGESGDFDYTYVEAYVSFDWETNGYKFTKI